MPATIYQQTSRVDPGTAVQRLRRQRLRAMHDRAGQPPAFADHLRQARRVDQQPDREPPIVKETEDHDEATQAQRRMAWRSSFMDAYRILRRRHPEASRSQLGWIMTRVGRALTDDPYMSKRGIKSLLDSLAKSAPDYEEAA